MRLELGGLAVPPRRRGAVLPMGPVMDTDNPHGGVSPDRRDHADSLFPRGWKWGPDNTSPEVLERHGFTGLREGHCDCTLSLVLREWEFD